MDGSCVKKTSASELDRNRCSSYLFLLKFAILLQYLIAVILYYAEAINVWDSLFAAVQIKSDQCIA